MSDRKPRVVFPFVEAGFGHIMAEKSIADAFEKKYGKYCEVIRSDFFKETGICFIKTAQIVTVNIQYSLYLSMSKNRNNNFRAGKRTAGYMSGELFYIGHYQGSGFCP